MDLIEPRPIEHLPEPDTDATRGLPQQCRRIAHLAPRPDHLKNLEPPGDVAQDTLRANETELRPRQRFGKRADVQRTRIEKAHAFVA